MLEQKLPAQHMGGTLPYLYIPAVHAAVRFWRNTEESTQRQYALAEDRRAVGAMGAGRLNVTLCSTVILGKSGSPGGMGRETVFQKLSVLRVGPSAKSGLGH